MDVLAAILAIMGGSILILLKVNKRLRTKNKLKDLEIEDVKLESDQKNIEKEKGRLKELLKKIQVEEENLNDSEIEEFWNNKKRK